MEETSGEILISRIKAEMSEGKGFEPSEPSEMQMRCFEIFKKGGQFRIKNSTRSWKQEQ